MIQSRPDESGERLEDAFGQLLESLRPDLVRFAYWLARDRAIAEDVVQEAMLRAMSCASSRYWSALPPELIASRHASVSWRRTG
jgi:DNA-directed RNA polymerase specialized sigma24 family protein